MGLIPAGSDRDRLARPCLARSPAFAVDDSMSWFSVAMGRFGVGRMASMMVRIGGEYGYRDASTMENGALTDPHHIAFAGSPIA